MAGVLLTGLEAAVAELGPVLARACAALLGGAATAGTASLSGDTAKEDSKAAPVARTLPRTGESCKKCPPEETGRPKRANHSMTPRSREYQGRITGRPYSVEEGWSEEWEWFAEFDGFVRADCLLQEAKAGYDKFLDENGKPIKWFQGFRKMADQVGKQARPVRANPPARLMWYFETPRARAYMLPVLNRYGVPSVVQP